MAKKEALNPQIIESKNNLDNQEKLYEIAKTLKESEYVEPSDNADSFFRSVINSLFDTKDISTKTEYLSVQENFAGTRLEFFSQYAEMPFLKNFVKIFEEKRVSLERKGRKELIMALQEKHQEMKQDKLQNFAKLFDVT